MPFRIVLGDITKLHVDAIVNAANQSLLGGGGVDGAIHRAAGPDLLKECRTLGGCPTGQAKVTLGYDLPAKYVIHTVGPIWNGGGFNEEELLRSAYRNSLFLADEKQCESVAFPLISAGVYGYPKDQALKVASDEIRKFLSEHEMDITLVIFSKDSFCPDRELLSDVSGFLRKNYEHEEEKRGSFLGNAMRSIAFGGASGSRDSVFQSKRPRSAKKEASREMAEDREVSVAREEAELLCDEMPDNACAYAQSQAFAGSSAPVSAASDMSLQEALANLDESFSQALLRIIDSKGMKDSECYKKANVDRKLFSKIRSDIHYRPSKQTVLAFAVALELDLSETEALLKKAGFALSHASKSDVIVEYFISRKNYDLYSINEALFAFDQNLLGA